MRFHVKRIPGVLALLTVFLMMKPALAEEVDLQFKLPISEVLTYKINTTLYTANEPVFGGAETPMLEFSAVLNIEIEPENADGLHPFTYWFDSFELTLFGLPFRHLLGPERWTGMFTPQRELLDVEEPPVLSELGIIMALMLADIFLPTPQQPVSVGDSWEVGYQLSTGVAELELDISARYTLLSYDLENGTAQLSEEAFAVYTSVLEPTPGVLINAQGEITSHGESVVDLQTGVRLWQTGRTLEAFQLSLPDSEISGPVAPETIYYASQSTLERIWPGQ